MTLWLSGMVVAAALAAQPAGRASRVEDFDLTGLPAQSTTFAEQKLRDLVSGHRPGDRADAVRIQQKLAEYYRSKGDLRRATEAEDRARAVDTAIKGAGGAAGTGSQSMQTEPAAASGVAPERGRTPAATPANKQAGPWDAPPPGRHSDFSGRFYGMEGRLMHTWDFYPDGTFLHRTIAGSAASTSERGTFAVSGGVIDLYVTRQAASYSAPTVGGRGTAYGGGANDSAEHRRLKIGMRGPGGKDGIVLDGVELKVKSW